MGLRPCLFVCIRIGIHGELSSAELKIFNELPNDLADLGLHFYLSRHIVISCFCFFIFTRVYLI